ncbi:MAG TPA: methyltransferase domain-containing protein [Limnochordia bacterium]|nr:methyltransferase domain-containing protein [Limnochordia bacterium]
MTTAPLESLLPLLRCPYTGFALSLVGNTLRSRAHEYPLHDGIPSLVREEQVSAIDQYFQQQYGLETARTYDRSIFLLSLLVGCWEPAQRRRLVQLLDPPAGGLLLEVSLGTGANLPLLAEALGPRGEIVGIDLSSAMLQTARRRAQVLPIPVHLVQADACHLPFADNTFDAVFHFGGINMFGDVPGALREMVRVAKPGAPIVVGDEGMSEKRRRTFWGSRVAQMNNLYLCRPPFAALPWEHVQGFQLHWAWRELFYLFRFHKARPEAQSKEHHGTSVQAEVRRRVLDSPLQG